MFRASDPQGKLFGGHNRLREWVGEDSIYTWLASAGPALFPDETFRAWYCEDNGRPCVAPHLLAVATILQVMHRCSDQEAIERTKYDDRWKCALDLDEEELPFCKSTMQLFRARLHLNENAEALFRGTLKACRRSGLLKGESLKAVMDTTPILGRGAIKDTYNLVADGIKALCRALSQALVEELEGLTRRLDLSRYFESSSLKGGAGIDWSDDQERRVFLNGLLADARRLLLEAQRAKEVCSEEQRTIVAAAEDVLNRLLAQDTEPDPDGPAGRVRIKKGVARDRVPSVSDPEVRHGRKSASKRFDGHKLAAAFDPITRLVTALAMQPGNTSDSLHALDLVKETEENTGMHVEKAIGDCAYGDGATREAFVEAERELVAKVPAPPAGAPFHKTRFDINLAEDRVTCPAGQETTEFKFETQDGHQVKRFHFAEAVCQACPHKGECLFTKDGSGGRTVGIHPQEALLQAAREYQKTDEFREDLKTRQRAEHGLARLLQIGGRQARYLGLVKTRTQFLLVAMVLNLTLLFKHVQALGQELELPKTDEFVRLPALMPEFEPRGSACSAASPHVIDPLDDAIQRAMLAYGPRGEPGLPDHPRSARGDPPGVAPPA